MKRTLRFTAFFLVICLLCGSLCGCSLDVDELRSRHGVRDEQGNITLNGIVYKPLSGFPSEFSPRMDTDKTIFVGGEDMPMLWALDHGEDFNISADGVFLKYADSYSPVNSFYCRSDYYDKVTAQFAAVPEMTLYEYEYSYVDEDEYINRAVCTLTAAQADTYIAIWNACEWKLGTNEAYRLQSSVELMRRSKNDWFRVYDVTVYFSDDEQPVITLFKKDTEYISYYATVDEQWCDDLMDLLKPYWDGQKQIDELLDRN